MHFLNSNFDCARHANLSLSFLVFIYFQFLINADVMKKGQKKGENFKRQEQCLGVV